MARGAYLVEGLGHCGACHTPRALTMQEEALTRRRQRAERIYYCTRILWVFLLLFLSILSMVGNSYTPFLYNMCKMLTISLRIMCKYKLVFVRFM